MKKVQYLFVAAALLFCGAVRAQQDFSGPQYAKWGDTVEERQKNILSSNFLKEACDNKDYNAAAPAFYGVGPERSLRFGEYLRPRCPAL